MGNSGKGGRETAAADKEGGKGFLPNLAGTKTSVLWYLRRAFVVVMVTTRSIDFVMDWGFYLVSIKSDRFKYFVEDGSAFSYDAIHYTTLISCIAASLLFLPDGLAFWFARRKHEEDDLYEPPIKLNSAKIIALVLCFEDIPQSAVSIIYLDITSKRNAAMCSEYAKPLDPLAVASLVLACVSMGIKLVQVLKPGLMFEAEKVGGSVAGLRRRLSAKMNKFKDQLATASMPQSMPSWVVLNETLVFQSDGILKPGASELV